MPRVKSFSNKEKRVKNIVKLKKDEIIQAHKRKHPTEPALYLRTKAEIARELVKPQWWPVRDFPVTIEK